MSTRLALALGTAALLALAAPAAAQKSSGLGTSLAGESCAFGTATSAPNAVLIQPILCGAHADSATLLSARVRRPLPADRAARHDAIVSDATALPGGLGRGPELACDPGTAIGSSGDDLLYACTVASTGWPRVVLIAVAGDILYEGEGTPALLPVLEAAVAEMSGHATPPAEAEAALHMIETKYPGALAKAGGAEAASDAALVELARLNGAQQNYGASEAAYRRALDIETGIFGDKSAAVGQTLMELALQVSNQGRFAEAEGLFQRAQPIIQATGTASTRARFQSYLALNAANQRHYEDALKYARAATAMRRAELAQDHSGNASRSELAHSLRIEAAMAMKLDDLPGALAAAEEVLAIVEAEPSLPLWWRPDTVAMMADINAQSGRVVEAERQYREALVMDQKLFGDTAPTAAAALRLGRFYSSQQLYTAALAAFRPAFGILAHDEVARAALVPDQIVPFLTAASAIATRDAAQRAQLQTEMFRASQLVGSSVEGRTIALAAARLAAGNKDLADLARQAQDAERARDSARIELAAETAKPEDERNPDREKSLTAAMQDASKTADALTHRIDTAFPDYAHLADPGPADLAAVEKVLGEHEGFLTFVVGTNSSYALLATRQGLAVAALTETDAMLASDVAELRQAFTPRLGVLPEYDLAAAFELYQRLMGPLDTGLQGIDRIVVAPTGALASLPLALLVSEKPVGKANYAQAAWLVRRFALSEVPSPVAFLALRQAAAHRTPAPRPLLAVADPAFIGRATGGDAVAELASGCRAEGVVSADAIRALPPLHETAGEVRTVAHLLGGSDDALLLGAAATEANLRAQQLDQYDVLYFATHGLLPGELRCQSQPALVLSPPATPARTAADDGILDASEIAGLHLNADLVVLSACNTAASGGEALAGLADAFFNAGARSVLASHWEVPSLSTVKLMTGIFAGGGAGGDLADALRRSELALIRDPATAHPYNWAAFTIIGTGAAPQLPAQTSDARGRT